MNVLMVITGADRLKLRDGTTRPTGYWAEEVAVPHELFRNAGLEVAIVTPGGLPAPVDEASLVRRLHVGGKWAVAVFHGPAGKRPAVREEGRWGFEGYRLTAFTNQEEKEVGLADKVPFLLQNRLPKVGPTSGRGLPSRMALA